MTDAGERQAGWPGRVLGGKYRVLRAIGHGGIGSVYEAEAGILKVNQSTADAAVDLFVAMCREDLGFRVVRFGDVADVHLLGTTGDNDSHLAGRMAELLAAQHGDDPSLPSEQSLVIAVKIADALVKFAFAMHPDGDDDIIQHAKQLIRVHLELANSSEAETE